jgi:hypothetical protein
MELERRTIHSLESVTHHSDGRLTLVFANATIVLDAGELLRILSAVATPVRDVERRDA